RGIPAGGEPVTCYSIIMQPAREDQASIHDRMPLLIPASFTQEWLAADEPPTRELMDAALDAGREMTARVRAAEAAA
ncbi:MAG TPA: SOS response-associated peptidase family protein, partial [Microbacteriaceae bacterium]|nr:SOS response-associated peptidase family protein [Microbacteriaceae bacterium]